MPCSAGTYQDRAGQTQCNACQVGKFQNNTGSATCTDCPSGRTSPAGATSCSTDSGDGSGGGSGDGSGGGSGDGSGGGSGGGDTTLPPGSDTTCMSSCDMSFITETMSGILQPCSKVAEFKNCLETSSCPDEIKASFSSTTALYDSACASDSGGGSGGGDSSVNHDIAWDYSAKDNPLTVHPGDTVTFDWSTNTGEPRNVKIYPSQAQWTSCNSIRPEPSIILRDSIAKDTYVWTGETGQEIETAHHRSNPFIARFANRSPRLGWHRGLLHCMLWRVWLSLQRRNENNSHCYSPPSCLLRAGRVHQRRWKLHRVSSRGKMRRNSGSCLSSRHCPAKCRFVPM